MPFEESEMRIGDRDQEKGWVARKLARLRLFEDPLGQAATREPETIVLPGEGPTVEIFVGTAPDLIRATRILVWSVMEVRNPARRYRIHLMADLKGYDRKGWKTGYQDYSEAVADFEGGAGRAIYCEATMIFMTDPATLFDAAPTGLANLMSTFVPEQWRQSGDAPIIEGAGHVVKTAWSTRDNAASQRVAQWRALEADANLCLPARYQPKSSAY